MLNVLWYVGAMRNELQATLSTFAVAVRALLKDRELAYADPAERALVARIRDFLHEQYKGWSIDLEWNRREDVIKRLRYDLSENELIAKDAIVPDLIVHRIGKRENLLVVEVKKSTNKNFNGDIWKLRGMTEHAGEYGYAVGLHLVIDVKTGTAPRSDVYVDAELDEELSDWMQVELGART